MKTDDTVHTLPVASAREVRAQARRIAARHRGPLFCAVALHALAAASGLVTPRLLGGLIGEVSRGTADVTRAVVLILVFVVAQAVILAAAVYASARLGETVLAELREEFVDNVLTLPLATVERAGTGDLVNRTTRDVDMLSRAVRQAVPDTLFAGTTIVLTVGALILVDPLLALPCLVAVPVLWAATRWYLRRARDGYLRQSASYARITDGLTDTAEGARTVEALRIAHRRTARADADITESYQAERYTLYLRSVFLPICDVAYVLPVAATLVLGGVFYLNGLVTLAAVATATLYVQQVIVPVDVLLYWMNELQIGGASLARTLGVRGATPARASLPSPDTGDGRVELDAVSFAYREGHDVLCDVTLRVEPGERIAVVGPSGAGKSTLGRLVAGIEPPTTGTVTIDGVALADLAVDDLRRRVALVTQEHYVFAGTLRENLVMARPSATDDDLEKVLKALDAWDWVAEHGLDTAVGAGGAALSPAQAQQLALARLALADPQVVVLDEATSLLAPRAARHVERSLAAVLEGRTVIAIAHRLHTAHDADRIVVLEDGRIVESGSHDELVRAEGAYAALWRSWHG
ncbi:ABC transporter ATP-binding protein [Micromonospora okii]|uniref:ABC transporter ATP-binding protein n=1 Tax=Micromonospora okii TaxID=1182970 RepID=UPI001E2FAC17|nr:ABC transporter ATP-binding protein [Micromonospora okii]